MGKEIDKRILSLILLIILLLSLLYAWRINITPRKIEVKEAANFVGDYVEVAGIAIKVQKLSRATLLTLEDGNYTLEVFLNFKEDIKPGCILRLRGIITTYRGELELLVENKKDVEVIARAQTLPLSALLSSPQSFLGMRLVIRGEIQDVKEYRDYHYLRISDGINTTWVHVPWKYYGERRVHLVGVVKEGILNVERISLVYNSEEYENVSVGEISHWEGKRIHVYAVILNYSKFLRVSGYLVDGNYTIRIWSYTRLKTSPLTTLTGYLRYDDKRGYYYFQVERADYA